MTIVQRIRPAVHAAESYTKSGAERRRDFPTWHFPMVNDESRNRAIEEAIASLDLRGKSVVEIGTGTGLIALLFARHGAERVYTCEMNPNLAELAKRIVDEAGFADKVSVINESSAVAIARGLLPKEPGVVFTETLDCGVIGEGFFPIADDIAKLRGPDTLVMPATVTQYVTLIESATIANLNRAGHTCGFDLSALNTFSTRSYFPVRSELHRHRFLSHAAEVRTYTYLDCPPSIPAVLTAVADGTVHGVMSWFSADFGGAITSTEPESGSHWHQAFHPLQDDMHVKRGDKLAVEIDDSGYAWVVKLD
ncbi:MAG: ribonucleotide-diphosphate reductase subunit beta [Aestuariivirga sp.]